MPPRVATVSLIISLFLEVKDCENLSVQPRVE